MLISIRFSLFLELYWFCCFFYTNLSPESELLIPYYFNYTAALISFLWLNNQIKKKSQQLGFIFMLISGLKFLFFFILYSPLSTPPEQKKILFVFFYSLFSLYNFEVVCLVKLMNKKTLDFIYDAQNKRLKTAQKFFVHQDNWLILPRFLI